MVKQGPLNTSKLNCILDYGNKHNISKGKESKRDKLVFFCLRSR